METKQRSTSILKVSYEGIPVDMFYLKLLQEPEDPNVMKGMWNQLLKQEAANMDFYIVLN